MRIEKNIENQKNIIYTEYYLSMEIRYHKLSDIKKSSYQNLL